LPLVLDHELPADGLAVDLASDRKVAPLALARPAQLAFLLRERTRLFALIASDIRRDVPGAADGLRLERDRRREREREKKQ
jgi:hypothetical protein